ncbi:hypothetical protein EV1_023576 [Malus domestica]
MATVPGQLIWEIVKKNNSFLVKEFGRSHAGVRFTKEPNNLLNFHSYKHSGLANKKTVTLQGVGKYQSVLLETTCPVQISLPLPPEDSNATTRNIVILYILLSEVLPFWAETKIGIFRQILQGRLDFESEPWPGISRSARDLLGKMLERNPRKRITAHEVFCHPWIIDDTIALDKPLDSAVLSRMKQFSTMNELKKMALRVIDERLSEEEIGGLRKVGSELMEFEIKDLININQPHCPPPPLLSTAPFKKRCHEHDHSDGTSCKFLASGSASGSGWCHCSKKKTQVRSYKSGLGSQSPSSLDSKPSSPPVSPAHRQLLPPPPDPAATENSPSIAARSSIASCLRSSSPKVFQGLMSWAWVRRLVCFRCSATAFECDPPQRLASLELITMATMIAKNFNDRRQTTSRS